MKFRRGEDDRGSWIAWVSSQGGRPRCGENAKGTLQNVHQPHESPTVTLTRWLAYSYIFSERDDSGVSLSIQSLRSNLS